MINELEWAVLEEIASYNIMSFPFIKEQLSSLSVEERTLTGVGEFLKFDQSKIPVNGNEVGSIALSSPRSLAVDNLEYALSFEIVVQEGKIYSLELVANGESWDGSFRSFEFKEV